MLTKLTIRNFKLFDHAEIELGERVVLIGPNNAGKTSALQALALWEIGVKRWLEKRGSGEVPEKRPGVTINRRDLIAVPIPAANLLWRDLHVREGVRENGKTRTQNVLVEVLVDGIDDGKSWSCGLEFDYANEESFYCRPSRGTEGRRMEVPARLSDLKVAYLPPMSGLSPREDRLEMGAINVRMGEGRTAEVLRNLCWQVLELPEGTEKWRSIVDKMQSLFGIQMDEAKYVKERGEIVMTFRTRDGIPLDLSSSGRGQQQTLLLLAHMNAHPGAVLLLDEPDAHLEILRQRQIYQLLMEQAAETRSQIIAASHSEVMLNEAADRDLVIAFVGTPHRIDDRGSQVLKALKEIGFEHYYLAEQVGWVLQLEGSTDLAVLRAFAEKLNHPAKKELERPFVHYVANQPRKALEHFHALWEAKGNLIGIAIYDHLANEPPADPSLVQMMWRRRELENYLCQRETLMAYAKAQSDDRRGPLFTTPWQTAMETAINEVEGALKTLGRPSPWGPEIKASDEFLEPVFAKFFEILALANLMRKTDFHSLVPYVAEDAIDVEITEKLDAIVKTAAVARPAR